MVGNGGQILNVSKLGNVYDVGKYVRTLSFDIVCLVIRLIISDIKID